ncbi:MAG: Rne/Rng family ribonuclease [Alphaproteobacteria bacterium]
MGKKMLIDAAHPEETRVVVVQGNRIEEFDFESAAKRQLRGSIYLAKVTRVEPSLQAAFVDYGGNRHGFLAFSEIHPDYYQIPVADRRALVEEEAAEDRRLAEEQDSDEERPNALKRGSRRRSRRGRGRRPRSHPGTPTPDGKPPRLAVSVDALEGAEPSFSFGGAGRTQKPDDVIAPSGTAAQTFTVESGPAAATAERSDDGASDHRAPALRGTSEASLDVSAGDAITIDAEMGPSAEDTPSASWPSDPDGLPSMALGAAEETQTSGSRPLLSDPMPSIAVRLPDDSTQADDGPEASNPSPDDTSNVASPDAEGDTDAPESGASELDHQAGGPADPDGPIESPFMVSAPDGQPEGDPVLGDASGGEISDGSPSAATAAGADAGPQARGGDGDEIIPEDETPDEDEDDDEDEETGEDDDSDDDEDDDEDDDTASSKGAANGDDEIETVGSEDAFEEVRPRRARLRTYKIQEVIKRRQIMLVQVVKEERGNKGAALTTYLSLAGRYCVLMPNTARGGGISRKITQVNDRKRLKEVAAGLEVPEGMGLIVRTAGANRTKMEIKRDFEYLLRLWENVRELTLRSSAPTLVYEEGNLVKRAIRDLYNKEIESVQVEGEEGYHEAKAFMRMLTPSHAKNVQAYKDRMPLFQRYQVEQQLDSMFSPTVELPSGGYLVINSTEALVAVDVNSGRATKEHSIEDTALRTNVEAAEEVARQLRLRDLAGLIVIDFIDMEDYRNNRTVEKRLKDCIKNDRARIQIGKISAFGLLEMSRQRLRAGVLEGSTQHCPHCEGTGKMRSVESASLRVLRACEEEGIRERCATATVRVPQNIALYMLNQKRRQLMDLELRYGLTVVVEADHTLSASEFQLERGELLTDEKRAEIRDMAISMETAYDTDLDEPIEDADGEMLDGDAEDMAEDVSADGEATADTAGEDSGDKSERPRRRRRRRGRTDGAGQAADAADGGGARDTAEDPDTAEGADDGAEASDQDADGEQRAEDDDNNPARRRRRRGKRGGRRSRRRGDEGDEMAADGADQGDDQNDAPSENADTQGEDRAEGDKHSPETLHPNETGPLAASAAAPPGDETAGHPAVNGAFTEMGATEMGEPARSDPAAEDHAPHGGLNGLGAHGDGFGTEASSGASESSALGEEHETPEHETPEHETDQVPPAPKAAPVEEDSGPKRRGWWQRRLLSH